MNQVDSKIMLKARATLWTATAVITVLCMFAGVKETKAQRTVVVEPDNYPAEIGNLNRTIEEELAIDPETIFILQRDATYWTEALLEIEGAKLHIRAEEGEGHPPIVRSAVDLEGEGHRFALLYEDATFEGIYINSFNEAGTQSSGPFQMSGAGDTLRIHNCYVEGGSTRWVQFSTGNNKLIVTDSFFRNTGTVGNPGNGRMVDNRGEAQDIIFFENNTFYNIQAIFLSSPLGLVPYNEIVFNHNTIINGGYGIAVDRVTDFTFTNNLLINFHTQAKLVTGSFNLGTSAIIEAAPFEDFIEGMTDEDRTFTIRNNNIGYLDQEFVDLAESRPPVSQEDITTDPELPEWYEGDPNAIPWTRVDIFSSLPHQAHGDMESDPWWGTDILDYENNITEPVEFADPPDTEPYIEYMEWMYFREIDPPWTHDRHEDKFDDPAPASTTLELWRDFSYSSDHESYTAAEGGFPVGDLNWFPELKQLWEDGGTVISVSPETVPETFRLIGNFPNPFNPTTTITYELAQPAEVTLEVMNVLGQRIRTFEPGMKVAGRHEVAFDAANLPSGIYLLRIRAGEHVSTHTMTLNK